MNATRHEFFFFHAHLNLHETTKAEVTVVFSPEASPDLDRLGEGLKAAVGYPFDPALVLLVGLEPHSAGWSGLATSLEDFVPRDVAIATIVLDSRGAGTILGTNPGDVLEESRLSEYVAEIFESGLQEMFERGSTVIRSAPGYHFEAPGGKHMSTFVRTGNMLADTARATFAACTILPLLSTRLEDIRHISTDTSSINSVGYELVRLQREFFPAAPAAAVGSFGGHAAIAQRVSLNPAATTLFLVSVSSTGGLIVRLRDERPNCQIIVLIDLGPASHGAPVMYAPGVRHEIAADLVLDDAVGVDRRDCLRCQDSNETIVKIDGEQLLPLTPSVYSRLLVRKQALDWAPPHLQAIVDLDAAQAHFVPQTRGTGSTRRPIYFEFGDFFAHLDDPMSAVSPAVEELREATLTKLAAMVEGLKPTHIVHLTDVSSEKLASVAQRMTEPPAQQVEARSASNLTSAIDSAAENRLLVVASAASSGSALNALSRDLRPLVRNSSVSYFVFMPRTQDAETWRFLSSNLKIGRFTGTTTQVESVIPAWLPSEKTLLGSVWDDEETFWTALVERLDRLQRVSTEVAGLARAQLNERLRRLGVGSLKNELFLSSTADINADEHRLMLQDNFAFWPFTYSSTKVSQASVYMTFAAVLDWSRSPGGAKQDVDYHQSEGDPETELERFFDTTHRLHNLTAVHPFNFDRYNDAITHAALLRGCLPWELDYSSSPGLSASMLGVLSGVVEGFEEDPANSALVEFLLALASGRLRLHPRHLELFVERLAIALPPVGEVLVSDIVLAHFEAPTSLELSPTTG